MNKKMIIESLLGMVIGGVAMFTFLHLIPKELLLKFYPKGDFETFAFFVSLLVGPFFAIALHELGHLTAGFLQKHQLQLFVVAFFGLKRENQRVRLFFNKEMQYFGGISATSPINLVGNLKIQFARILGAGPLFSLLFGGVFLFLFYYFDSAWNGFNGIVGLISIALFFATTIPSKSGLFFTDRKRLQRLLNKGKVGEIELALLQASFQMLLDQNAKNLEINKLQLIQTDTEPVVQFWGFFFEYAYYKDHQNTEKAASLKNNLLNYQTLIPKGIWKSLAID